MFELCIRKYAAGTTANKISGGWTTAVNRPDRRTDSTAATHPIAYSEPKTFVRLPPPDPASKANPNAQQINATATAPHQGSPEMSGCAERCSAGTAGRVRCADTCRPYRLYLPDVASGRW